MKQKEIVFRGFHEDKSGCEKVFVGNRWVKGYWVKGQTIFHTIKDGKYKYLLIPSGAKWHRCAQDGSTVVEWEDVIPETIGQFAGLTANEEEIFEDDIVEFKDLKHGQQQAIVYFCSGKFSVNSGKCKHKDILKIETKIIGNTFSNPELIPNKNDR